MKIFDSQGSKLRCFVARKPSQQRLVFQARPGFTLIEILLAIARFSAVLFGIYSAWTAILRGSKAGLTAAAEAQRSRITLRAIEEALGSALLFTGNLRYYSFLADTRSDFAALSFVSRLPSSFPGSGLFGDQVVRRVTFMVEPGHNGQNQLVLKQSPLLEPPEANAQPYTIVLSPSVSQFEVEFFDTNKLRWFPEWPRTNQLPKMVRVYLSFGQQKRLASQPGNVSVQTVLLTATAIPRELQMPGRRLGVGGPPIAPGRPQPGTPIPQPNTAVPPEGLQSPDSFFRNPFFDRERSGQNNRYQIPPNVNRRGGR
jgi:type II secretory pathway pseudopilin PulG